MSATTLPIFVALIGLAGALIGAAAGLAGNQLALLQQTARAERNFRRDVYSSFLQAARNGHSDMIRRDAIKTVVETNDLATGLKANTLDAAAWIASAEKLDDVAAQLHRLHVAAHPLAYDAAVEIYQALGSTSTVSIDDDADLHHAVAVHFYTAIGVFTDIARADSHAPGHKQLSTFAKQVDQLKEDGKTLEERVRQFARNRATQLPIEPSPTKRRRRGRLNPFHKS